jgi:type IV pilus assembly protein PilY1
VTDATFRAGRLIFASMIPDSSTPCVGGGSGWLLEFDAITGNRLDTATFDTNGDNTLTTSDFLTFGVVGSGSDNVSGRRIQGIPATPAFMSSGKLDFRLIPNSDATLESIAGGLGAGRDGRAMWREVR